MADSAALAFQQCRAMGHSWKHQKGNERTMKGVGLHSICSVCKARRVKWLDGRGQLLGSDYTYPDGYSLHGEERLPGHEWRSLYVHTLFPDI